MCNCKAPFGVKDYIESVYELKETSEHLYATHEHLIGNPTIMVGTNIPSVFGGHVEEVWYKNRNRKGIRKDLQVENKFGPQSYSDNKIELLGHPSFSKALFL